ncbi:SPOR domain-containing protein [Desulfosarcina sp.]|uniref:SPOR domain-containing protein n=1 Tax=Desulfosarcina sp. TaxID=2027861 RepID=UPI0039704BF0
MGHLFKHLAVRLWVALVIGGLTALVVLPPFAGTVGPGWMIVPGLCLLAAAFWLTGMVFAAMGRRRLARLLGEATVWDRAGMVREARQALTRAAATVDSFFFSPLSRKAPAGKLLAQMARFQLAQSPPEPSSDAIIGTYLNHFPRDRDAAVKWLDGVLSGRAVTQKSHDIAARIGTAHLQDTAIQRMLAQFYLAERCCDFAALQTYRQLMDAGEPLAEALLCGVADLFLAQPRADRLALQVYLDVYQRGGRDARLLPGIAACCRMIHPSPVTLPLLERADAVLDGVGASQREKMASAFLPEIADARPDRSFGKRPGAWPAIGPSLRKVLAGSGRLTRQYAAAGLMRLRKFQAGISSRRAKSALKWTTMGLFVIAVGWLVINTAWHLSANFKTVEKVPELVVKPVTDPFTLQVAAYLKETDARHYVDQLKGQGLDAYWTRASGGSKTWYQVRISHFKTKAEARSAGEDLKKRQLIGDFYVANYKRPDVP